MIQEYVLAIIFELQSHYTCYMYLSLYFSGTIPKSSDFNNYIRRRFTLINADATLNQRKSA